MRGAASKAETFILRYSPVDPAAVQAMLPELLATPVDLIVFEWTCQPGDASGDRTARAVHGEWGPGRDGLGAASLRDPVATSPAASFMCRSTS